MLLIDLPNENKEVLKRKQFEKDVIINTRSSIFKSLEEIDFIINRLKNTSKLQNKKISFNLLFKAIKDGQNSSDFHKKCGGKVQQLTFIKTTEGEIFGGYKKLGFITGMDILKIIMPSFFLFIKEKYMILKGREMLFMIAKVMELVLQGIAKVLGLFIFLQKCLMVNLILVK